MSRAERRRAEREATHKKATYVLNAEQIAQIKKDATDEAVDRAFILMLGLPIMVLHDKYPKIIKKETRLVNFMDELLELYDSYNKGYFTLQDLIDTIYKETGVYINGTSNGSGYIDPTAYKAIKIVSDRERLAFKVIKTIQNVAHLAGFDIVGRIELRDNNDGKVYK